MTDISKKQIFLCQWDYKINCNENENDNRKTDHINKTQIDQDLDIEINIQNIARLGKTMPLCNKQHLSNIWGLLHYKVKQHWGWVEKKRCLSKKACSLFEV